MRFVLAFGHQRFVIRACPAFDEIEETFYTAGEDVLQIFVCDRRGKVRPVDKPNEWHSRGWCRWCQTLTDLRAGGCSFVLMSELT